MIRTAGKLLRWTALAFAAILVVGGGITAWYWHTGRLEAWVQEEIVRGYVKEIQPHLPFVVEDLEVHGGISNFLRGNIPDVSMTLHWAPWRIRLSGPIRIEHLADQKKLGVEYSPQATIEPDHLRGRDGERSSPVQLRLHAHSARDFKHFAEISLDATADRFEWKLLRVAADSPGIHVAWDGVAVVIGVGARSASWGQSDERQVSLTGISLAADTPLIAEPFQVGPELRLQWTLGNVEALWDSFYADLPLSEGPGNAVVQLEPAADWKSHFPAKSVQFTIGHHQEHSIHVSAGLRTHGKTLTGADLKWSLEHFPMREGQELLTKTLSSVPGALRTMEVLKGRAESAGTASLDLEPFGVRKIDGHLNIDELALRWPSASLALSKAKIRLPISFEHPSEGSIEIPHLLFRRFQGSLGKTIVGFKPLSSDVNSLAFDVHVGKTADAIPLSIEGLPIQILPLQGTLRLRPALDYDFKTGLTVAATPATPLLKSMCLENVRLPPATVLVEFPQIELTRGDIEPSGRVRVEAFEGAIEATNIGIYNLDEDVPEIDFSARMDAIRMDQLGLFLGFGEMDGLLFARADDVTFQATLPTRYDLLVKAEPHHRGNIVVFSAEAMKNFIKLFAGDALDRIPGFAKFLMFGWPKKMVGGYDVHYAGISANSEEGSIIIRTLDDPTLAEGRKVREAWKEVNTDKDHFILHGRWIRMPLKSSHYPLVVDAPAMGDFLHRVISTLGDLIHEKEKRENKNDEEPAECLAPNPPL